MRITTACLLAVPFFIACDGGGTSDSTKIVDLTLEESIDLCHEMIALNPEHTIQCSGVTITVGLTEADCDATTEEDAPPPNCTATVADARSCNVGQAALTDAEWCMGAEPEGCDAIFACVPE